MTNILPRQTRLDFPVQNVTRCTVPGKAKMQGLQRFRRTVAPNRFKIPITLSTLPVHNFVNKRFAMQQER